MIKKKPSCLGVIGMLALVPVAAFAGGLSTAFAVAKAWEWFVVPTFGVPQITYLTAFGLAALVHLLRPLPHDYAQREYESTHTEYAAAIGASLLTPMWMLGVLWIARALFA